MKLNSSFSCLFVCPPLKGTLLKEWTSSLSCCWRRQSSGNNPPGFSSPNRVDRILPPFVVTSFRSSRSMAFLPWLVPLNRGAPPCLVERDMLDRTVAASPTLDHTLLLEQAEIDQCWLFTFVRCNDARFWRSFVFIQWLEKPFNSIHSCGCLSLQNIFVVTFLDLGMGVTFNRRLCKAMHSLWRKKVNILDGRREQMVKIKVGSYMRFLSHGVFLVSHYTCLCCCTSRNCVNSFRHVAASPSILCSSRPITSQLSFQVCHTSLIIKQCPNEHHIFSYPRTTFKFRLYSKVHHFHDVTVFHHLKRFLLPNIFYSYFLVVQTRMKLLCESIVNRG